MFFLVCSLDLICLYRNMIYVYDMEVEVFVREEEWGQQERVEEIQRNMIYIRDMEEWLLGRENGVSRREKINQE